MTQELDRKDLKIQALLEKVSSLTTQYEDQVANLRVELTISEVDKNQLQEELNSLKAEANEETLKEDPTAK